MPHARPEYAIILAIVGVLAAVGVPALRRGQVVLGTICVTLAIAVVVWAVATIRRERD
jgi:hypothetical protein